MWFRYAILNMKESLSHCDSFSNGICSGNLKYHGIQPNDVGGTDKAWNEWNVFPCIYTAITVQQMVNIRMYFRESDYHLLYVCFII